MKFSITISAENRRGTTITWLEHTGQMPQRSCRNICKRCTAICSGKQVLTRCTVQTRERGNRSCPNNKNQLSHYSWRGDSVQREIPIDIVLFILFHPATTSLSRFVVSALNRVFANAIENLPWIPTYSICHVWEIVMIFFFFYFYLYDCIILVELYVKWW